MLSGKIHTKPSTKEYEDNWDKIFGKKKPEPEPEKEKEIEDELPMCNCPLCDCND